MYYSFDALNCCVCALFFSVVGFFVTTHWFGLDGHFNHSFIYLFIFLDSYLYFFFGFLISVPFVAVASLHSLTQVCISILTVVFCYSVGAVLILSDLLSLFFSWHSALVVFFALRFTWLVVFINLLFSAEFIACGTFYLFCSLLSMLHF